jgi:hypothetical protein
MLAICLSLILVLLWYISTQDYRKTCDRRIADMYYQAQMNATMNTPVVATAMNEIEGSSIISSMVNGDSNALTQPPEEKTMLEKHRINVFNPEKRVMDFIEQGDKLSELLKVKEDHLTLDELHVRQYEQPDDMRERSFSSANYNGAQLEGMQAPIAQFEVAAMVRQNKQKQDIYGAESVTLSTADNLSDLNL